MDQGELSKEALDVRKVIEKSTSKVSLRDLEKKGFRQVKVLRAGDINQLITKALKNILANQPRGGTGAMSEEERQEIIKEARGELDRQMAEKRQLVKEKKEIEAKGVQIQEAKQRLETKVAELNRQILAEKKAFQDEKRQFETQKQNLYEKGLQGQQDAARNFEGQIQDLRGRLESAQAEAQGAVSTAEYDRLKRRLSEAEDEVDNEKRKARQRIAEMEEEVERFRAENRKLREEGAQSSVGGVDPAELQRMRFEMEQQNANMRDMIGGIARSLAEAPKGGSGGGGGDMSKQFKSLQQSLSDQMRKGLNSIKGGGGEWDDLTEEAVAQMIANQTEDIVMETNARDVVVKETKAGSVKDKLARLRNMKKG